MDFATVEDIKDKNKVKGALSRLKRLTRPANFMFKARCEELGNAPLLLLAAPGTQVNRGFAVDLRGSRSIWGQVLRRGDKLLFTPQGAKPNKAELKRLVSRLGLDHGVSLPQKKIIVASRLESGAITAIDASLRALRRVRAPTPFIFAPAWGPLGGPAFLLGGQGRDRHFNLLRSGGGVVEGTAAREGRQVTLRVEKGSINPGSMSSLMVRLARETRTPLRVPNIVFGPDAELPPPMEEGSTPQVAIPTPTSTRRSGGSAPTSAPSTAPTTAKAPDFRSKESRDEALRKANEEKARREAEAKAKSGGGGSAPSPAPAPAPAPAPDPRSPDARKEALEKANAEKARREAEARAAKEAREKADREAREKAARERAERERKASEEKAAREQAAKEAREKAERARQNAARNAEIQAELPKLKKKLEKAQQEVSDADNDLAEVEAACARLDTAAAGVKGADSVAAVVTVLETLLEALREATGKADKELQKLIRNVSGEEEVDDILEDVQEWLTERREEDGEELGTLREDAQKAREKADALAQQIAAMEAELAG